MPLLSIARYLGMQSAAQYLGISERALRERVKRGTIPYLREEAVRRVSFDIVELDKYMASTIVHSRAQVRATTRKRNAAHAKEQLELAAAHKVHRREQRLLKAANP